MADFSQPVRRVSCVGRTLVVLGIFALIASVQILVHWYLASDDSPLAEWMRAAYFRVSPNGKTTIAGVFDQQLPAIVMGVMAGLILHRCEAGVLTLCIIGGAVAMAALPFAYGAMFSCYPVPGYTFRFTVGDMALESLKLGVVSGLVAYGSRLVALSRRPRTL